MATAPLRRRSLPARRSGRPSPGRRGAGFVGASFSLPVPVRAVCAARRGVPGGTDATSRGHTLLWCPPSRSVRHARGSPSKTSYLSYAPRSAGDGVAVLQAEPGAGKTTLVPLRLLNEAWLAGARIVVMEPRRVAARAAAARMAYLLGEEVGATVGYVTRDDRRVSRSTRIEVVTDGILTRRLQHEPDLPGVAMVIFDEFHERRLDADLGLALTLDARSGLRPELRVLVMSATLDVESLAALLGGVPVISSRGRTYPVALRWKTPPRPGRLATTVAAVVNEALQRDVGDVLTFLPGVGEIRAVAGALGRSSP